MDNYQLSTINSQLFAINSPLSIAFKRPFDEQVAFFRGKLGNLVPTAKWDDLWKSQFDRSFMVAGAAKADLLADLAGAVEKIIAEGETLDAFRKRFGEIVQRHGWHGWTGEGTKAGEAWRTRVIYETNLATSYSAGRVAQLKQGEHPLWMYRHADAVARPRPEHLAWDGLTLPPDHDFWNTHTPPNGWGCKCRVIGVRSPAQAKRLGGDPDKALPKGWDKVDRKTGELPGIDKGWGYQPGETVSPAVQSAAKKLVGWDYRLARAYMDDIPTGQRDAIATAMRTQPETGEVLRRYARRVLEKLDADVPPYQTFGLLTSDESSRIVEIAPHAEAVGKEIFAWAIDASTVNKVEKAHGTGDSELSRGQEPIVAEDYAMLPRILLHAQSSDIVYDKDSGVGHPAVRVLVHIAGRRYEAIFEIRTGRRMLALQTFYKGQEKR